jgi:hypothetical protein
MKTAMAFALAAVLAIAVSTAAPQQQKKGSDQTRSVQGVVTGADEKPVAGAVVQLKNSKTLQIRSFLSKDDGTYYFHGLSPDIDYELTARTDDASSGSKTLSSFDSRKEAVINLKLNPKK